MNFPEALYIGGLGSICSLGVLTKSNRGQIISSTSRTCYREVEVGDSREGVMGLVSRRGLTSAFQEEQWWGEATLDCRSLRTKTGTWGLTMSQMSWHDSAMRLLSLAHFTDPVSNFSQSSPMVEAGFMTGSLTLHLPFLLHARTPLRGE